jgi:hypothetical protein
MANGLTFKMIFDRLVEDINREVANKALAGRFCGKLAECKARICREYAAVNNYIKTRYMESPPTRLDRHKCTAAFMVAFLENFTAAEHNLNREYLAIYVGALVMKIFIRRECKNYGDLALLDLIAKNNGFVFPPCRCDDGEFRHSWALGMYYDRQSGRLSALSLANTIFLIESYNRQLLKQGCA